MSTKVKRKVTVENNKDNGDQHRRPSVFERLGPGAVSVNNTQQERHSRAETQEKCRNWLRSGTCVFGNTCRYQHDPFPNSSSRRNKSEKDIPEKDLRHKVRNKRDDNKESRTHSLSPKRKGSKRSGSRSRKGEHESKIKSTVVVTRPRSPAAKNAEPQEREKKKIDGTWEDDSDDWPLDSAQLDYKEELTLERKRQQLQRELELEYQKERMMNESVTITKTVSFSESSSSSSSSESGSISTTSDSSSSSSDDDSDDSSSSSSSSSSSASRPPKKKAKKPSSGKEAEVTGDSSVHQKPRDDYDKIKSSRAAKIGITNRSPIPSPEPPKAAKKGRDRRSTPPPPSPKHSRFPQEPSGSGRVKSRVKGPHTPSPPHSRKQRQWEQSSSADSRSADARQSRGKRHKKKRDAPRNDTYKSDRVPTPPPQLSSPNRTALVPNAQFNKKNRQKADDLGPKSRQRNRDSPPLLLSRMSGHSNSPSGRIPGSHGHHSLERERSAEPMMERSKLHMRKPPDDSLNQPKRSDSREQMSKRSRFSPRRDGYRDTLSPPRGKLEGDGYIGGNSRKPYSSPVLHLDKGDDRNDRRRRSPSPVRGNKDPRDRRSFPGEFDKKRELREPSPRPGRDNLHRNVDSRNYPRKDDVNKRGLSPDIKKGRDDKSRDRGPRDRNIDHEPLMWNEDHKKGGVRSNSANRGGDSRGWQDVQQLPPNSRGDRSRDKDRDRKKGKERDLPHRPVEEGDKQRLPSPIRGRSPLHGHHPIPEVDAPMSSQRGRMYEPDIPPGERAYGYGGYDAHRDPLYVNDRLMPPEYEPDLMRGPPVYGPEGYPEGGRYRRDPPLKDQGSLPRGERVGGYNSRDPVSSRDMIPSRDLERRNDDYLPDGPIDERHAYDERWGRNRPMRDEWDPYGGLPPSSHPPSALDEDRYGMPRRRRASPDWQLRNDDRELPPVSPTNHRQGNHPPLPPAQRVEQRGSRSPPPKRIGDASRSSWGERPGRNSSRGSDNRHDLPPKNQEDRKGRNGRRDHRDRGRRRDGGPPPESKPPPNKDKPNNKRPRSPSPIPKDCKKRKEDIPPVDSAPPAGDKNSVLPKRPREEPKLDRKPPPVTAPGVKTVKTEPPSPKGNTNSRSSIQDKADISQKNSAPTKAATKPPEKEEKKIKRAFPARKDTCRPEDLLKRYGMIDEKSQGGDDFSDWSDGDDDLLNRDDFNEVDIGDDFDKAKSKGDESQDKPKKDVPSETPKPIDGNSKQATDQLESAKVKPKEQSSQPVNKDENKEKTNEESIPSNKEKEPVQELKEYEAIDSFMVKDETDTDDYITTECVDYDPISDDELEAMIEEPDDQAVIKQDEKNENSGIVDALDVNWSTLMSESRPKTDFVPGFARKRFKTSHVLSQIGFSQVLAGSEMTRRIFKFCQEQLDQEMAEGNKDPEGNSPVEEKKFTMEHHIAAFHVAISDSKKERAGAFNNLGPNRRALCARKDLQIRKLLCQPFNKLVDQTPATYRQQCNVDKDLYKKSLELLNLRKAEYQARTVDVC